MSKVFTSALIKGYVKGIHLKKPSGLSFYESCVAGKSHHKPFSAVEKIHSTQKPQLMHSDVWGPMKTESIGGVKYFLTFIDDYSR